MLKSNRRPGNRDSCHPDSNLNGSQFELKPQSLKNGIIDWVSDTQWRQRLLEIAQVVRYTVLVGMCKVFEGATIPGLAIMQTPVRHMMLVRRQDVSVAEPDRVTFPRVRIELEVTGDGVQP